jgi:hypothetical protein
MKKHFIFDQIRLVIFSLIFFVIISCQSEDSKWNKIEQSNNPTDIEAFINEYPNGKYLKEAQNHLIITKRTIAYKNAIDLNTIEAYENYLKSYSDTSQQSIEINKILFQMKDENAYKEAVKINTRKAFESFLKEYPNSKHIEVAKKLLDNLDFVGSITVGGSIGWDMSPLGREGYFQGVWWLLTTNDSEYYLDIAPWDYPKIFKDEDGNVTVTMSSEDRPFSKELVYGVYGKLIEGKKKNYRNKEYQVIHVTKIITKTK